MMVLSHVVVGGVIGQETGNLFFAFFIGLFSHIIIDKIPHFWPKSEKAGKFFTWFDIGTSLSVMLVFWFLGFQSIGFWAGIVGSISLDCAAMTAKFLNKMKFYEWQNDRQPHLRQPIILLTDAFFIFAGLVFLWVSK